MNHPKSRKTYSPPMFCWVWRWEHFAAQTRQPWPRGDCSCRTVSRKSDGMSHTRPLLQTYTHTQPVLPWQCGCRDSKPQLGFSTSARGGSPARPRNSSRNKHKHRFHHGETKKQNKTKKTIDGSSLFFKFFSETNVSRQRWQNFWRNVSD